MPEQATCDGKAGLGHVTPEQAESGLMETRSSVAEKVADQQRCNMPACLGRARQLCAAGAQHVTSACHFTLATPRRLSGGPEQKQR